MPHIKRFIDDRLLAWVKSDLRKPMILRGARQVGKTASVRELARAAFGGNILEVNFERQPHWKKVFATDLNPIRIVAELEILSNQTIAPSRTLLFLDEVQECPDAIKALRYFFEEMPDLHVIAAGSLLEFALKKISMPVGRVNFEFAFPLSFREFLGAMGRDQLIKAIPGFWKPAVKGIPISSVVSTALDAALREYFVVGGMPAAVVVFRDTLSFLKVAQIQDEILQSFRDDIRKYARGEKQLENVATVFGRIFKFVGKQLSYTTVGDGDEIKRTRLSIHMLEEAMLIHRVSSIVPSGLPLGAEASEKHFKCIFLDIGLGQRSAGCTPNEILAAKDLLGSFEGRLAEQFVGQQLLAESHLGSENRRLYCWIRGAHGSSAEVDYVIVREGAVYPVEVKRGKAGSLKSLRLFLDTYGGRGLCLQQRNDVTTVGDVEFMPLVSIL